MGEELLGGRYELRGLIGSGGMARVYRAYDRTLKREVAVKTLVGDTLEEAQSVERFRREARAAANLSHPNIVGIYDWGETASNGAYGHPSYYMVMELIPGENLKQIIDARGPLPESEALDIAAQVAAALQAAHDHGVIHRDVKPQNILIGSSGQVKMTDFGIARAAGLTQLTATDAICGTPYYLSPEQAQRQALDNRSDVYGLGVVLYEMLTGTELFHGSPLEVAMRHVREEAPSPRALQPPVSAATETIVRKALAKKPADRFQSAGDMRTALRQARNRLALAEPLPPPAAAAVRPRRAPGTAGLTTQWRMRQPEAQPFRRKDGSLANPWWRVIPVILLVALFTGALAFLNSRNGGSSHGKKPVAAQPAATRTPQPTSTPKPKPTATHVAAAATHPTATTAPTPVPTPVPTSAPTSVPATTSPTGGVAVVSSSAGSPVAAVKSFYQLVSAHDFADAAALWSANMLAAYPPAANINDRFRDTQSIIVESYKVDSIDRSGGNAVVSVQLLETKTSGAQQTLDGAWSLVLTPSGWLLDSPSFTQASEYLRHATPPHPSHPDQGHGKGHDKSEKPAKSEKRAKPGKGQNAGEGE